MRLAQHIALGHLDVVEEELRRVLSFETQFIKVTAPLKTLGVLGLRTVNLENRVEFYPIVTLEDSPDGAWVTGLPERVRLITIGHEFVSEGQVVESGTAEAEVYQVPDS